jgi:deoxyadenosine/deoxycytidine kinase
MYDYTIDYASKSHKLSVKPVKSLYRIVEASAHGQTIPNSQLQVIVDEAVASLSGKGPYATPQKVRRISSPDLPSSPSTVSCLDDDFLPTETLYDMETISKLRELFFASHDIVKPLPVPEEHQPILISIEGNIGAGKSTLLQALRESHPEWTFIDEPVDFWTTLMSDKGESLFELYYHNQHRWAYTFQNCAVLSRYQLIENTISTHRPLKPGKHVYITERCLETDYHVFAKKLHADGKLDSLEYDLYERWFAHLHTRSTPLSGVILVDTDADTCADRIKGRNRDGEEGIPLDYLRELHSYQDRWLNSINAPCQRTCSVEDIEQFVSGILANSK